MANTKKTDTYYLDQLRQKIEEKLNSGPVSEWTERNFHGLGDLLEQRTGERVSVTTLKRLLGKIERKKKPHLKTLNNVANFVGYGNWSNYKLTLQEEAEKEQIATDRNASEETSESEPDDIQTGQPETIFSIDLETREQSPAALQPSFKQQRPAWRKWLTAAEVLTVVAVIGWLVYGFVNRSGQVGNQDLALAEKVDKAGRKPLGGKNTLKLSSSRFDYEKSRFTVNVEYYLPDVSFSNINLIKFNDVLQYLNINTQSKQGSTTHTYTEPGLYHIKIFSNKQTLAELPVTIPSKDWMGRVHFTEKDREAIDFNVHGIDKEKLAALLPKEPIRFWTSYRYFNNFSIEGETFILKSRFRNTPANNETRDGNTFLEVNGEHNDIRVQLANNSSSIKFFQVFSEQKTETLDGPLAFRTHLSDWQELIIKNDHQTVTVFLNGKELYQTTYKEPIGTIKGLQFSFIGLGEIDYLKIFSLQDELLYEEKFGPDQSGF